MSIPVPLYDTVIPVNVNVYVNPCIPVLSIDQCQYQCQCQCQYCDFRYTTINVNVNVNPCIPVSASTFVFLSNKKNTTSLFAPHNEPDERRRVGSPITGAPVNHNARGCEALTMKLQDTLEN